MADEVNKAEIAEALAAEMGFENRGDSNEDSSTDEFFRVVNEFSKTDPAPEAQAEDVQPAPSAFVYDHDGVHKEFDSREKLLEYESGRKSNEIGQLRAKLEAYEEMVKGAGEQPKDPVDPKKQEELVFQAAMRSAGIDLEAVDPSAYKTIWKIFEAGLGMYDQGVVNRRFTELQGTVEKITTRAQQAEALSAAGITAQEVRQTLEKHPSLKALPMGEQVAVIADLVKREQPKQGTGESPNAIRQALQPKAAGHVEGSVGSVPQDDYEGRVETELFKMDSSARMRALGKMFEESELGLRIKDAHI